MLIKNLMIICHYWKCAWCPLWSTDGFRPSKGEINKVSEMLQSLMEGMLPTKHGAFSLKNNLCCTRKQIKFRLNQYILLQTAMMKHFVDFFFMFFISAVRLTLLWRTKAKWLRNSVLDL